MRRTVSALASLVRQNGLTIGIELPLETETNNGCGCGIANRGSRTGGAPDLAHHVRLARMVDRLGFAALWLRDAPVHDRIGACEADSAFDIFTYLGFLAGITDNVVLGTAAMILPIRHPLMIAKAAASVDVLSGGRLVLGVSLGDNRLQHALLGSRFDQRYQAFREAVQYVREAWGPGGVPLGDGDREPTLDILPRPLRGSIPMIFAGRTQMDAAWISDNMDGRMVHPGPFRAISCDPATAQRPSALLTPFYLDLASDPDELGTPIHFGARIGRRPLIDYLRQLSCAGVHHVAFNMSRSRRPVSEILEELATFVLPAFEPDRVLIAIR